MNKFDLIAGNKKGWLELPNVQTLTENDIEIIWKQIAAIIGLHRAYAQARAECGKENENG